MRWENAVGGVANVMLATEVGSSMTTVLGTAATTIDTIDTIAKIGVNPLTFTVSMVVGALFATLAYTKGRDLFDNNGRDQLEQAGNIFPAFTSITVGIIPSALSSVSSYAARFFCGSYVLGFRAGFMGANFCFKTAIVTGQL